MPKISYVSVDLYEDSENVVSLDPDDFARKSNGLLEVNHNFCNGRQGFLMFYSHWCGHCKDMVSVWNNLADYLGNNGCVSAFNAADESSPWYKNIAKLNKVEYYPTIKFVSKDGTLSPYNGGRKLGDFIIFFVEHHR